jgi:hypothetical protein
VVDNKFTGFLSQFTRGISPVDWLTNVTSGVKEILISNSVPREEKT